MSSATIPPVYRAWSPTHEAIIEDLPDLKPGEPMVLTGVPWAAYERLLVDRDRLHPGVRLTYDRGRLEIITVSRVHERWKGVLARLLEAFTFELRIPIVAGRNLTIRREDLERGLEPDECYYVQHALDMVSMRELDFTRDPPFDLAIEVEQSRNVGSARLAVLDARGVGEVWLYNGRALRVLHRQAKGGYEERPASAALPQLPLVELERFLTRIGEVDDTTLTLEFVDWVRKTLVPPPAQS
jgi:Uma2 family endonuclease